MPEFIAVAKSAEIPSGRGRAFEVAGRSVAIFRIEDRVFAIDNYCPHRMGSLADGVVVGDRVRCPVHGWAFHLPTGECLVDERRSARVHAVRVENDQIFVES